MNETQKMLVEVPSDLHRRLSVTAAVRRSEKRAPYTRKAIAVKALEDWLNQNAPREASST